jgi:hypothetical protein
MIKKIINNYSRQKYHDKVDEQRRNLIRQEAVIGGQVFGPVPYGHRREFFCMDAHTWVWFEEWVDANGSKQSMTTRYEVRPSGLVKVQNGNYRPVSKEEAKRFRVATDRYYERVTTQLYAGIA